MPVFGHELDKATVLVGPNNEGKSNLLRALVLGMSVLTRGLQVHYLGRNRRILYHGKGYNWELDFPVNLQMKNPDGRS
jgi:AAA15 family ATPase/GTPase